MRRLACARMQSGQRLDTTFPCGDPESFVRGDQNLTKLVFLADEGIEAPNTTLSGSS